MIRMKQKYKKNLLSSLQKELGVSNKLALPRFEKVVINVSLGRLIANASKQKDFIDEVSKEFMAITGQKPIITKAKKSIASFKVREGNPVGLKVTLRGKRMNDFIDKLIHVALPRSRDFKGLKLNCVDKGGNLTIGIKEHSIFPEVAEITRSMGFEITIVSTAGEREKAIKFFRLVGIPLKSEKE
jgi:large subunit ribosomal protein L5